MVVSGKWYGKVLINAFKKSIDFENDEIKVMLTTADYTPNQDTDEFIDDITNEVVGDGYTAGGEVLGTPLITYDPDTNILKFDGEDVEWLASNISLARYAVIYDNTPTLPADKPVLGFIDFGEDKTSTGGNFKILWSANGILKATVS